MEKGISLLWTNWAQVLNSVSEFQFRSQKCSERVGYLQTYKVLTFGMYGLPFLSAFEYKFYVQYIILICFLMKLVSRVSQIK